MSDTMKPFFSIIVPWCDVEQYLRECLDSVTSQPFTDWECFIGVETSRDKTEEIVRVLKANGLPLYDIFNIGNHKSEKLLDAIETLATALDVEPKMEMLPMQAGDVYATYASIEKLNKAVGYEPKTTIREGIPVFAKWLWEYYAHK